jgi:hypothetical protein
VSMQVWLVSDRLGESTRVCERFGDSVKGWKSLWEVGLFLERLGEFELCVVNEVG